MFATSQAFTCSEVVSLDWLHRTLRELDFISLVSGRHRLDTVSFYHQSTLCIISILKRWKALVLMLLKSLADLPSHAILFMK